MAVDIDTHELAWAAGFFDGEGTVHLSKHKGSPNGASLHVGIHQVEREPLERFRRAVAGLGSLYDPRANPPGRPISLIQTTSFETGQAIVAMLWKFLSAPKRQQAAAALTTKRSLGRGCAPRNRRTCCRGHDMDDAHVDPRGRRRCRECIREDARAQRARRKARVP